MTTYSSWFEARETYDCPLCVQEADDDRHYGVFGAFEVTATIQPRIRGTHHSPPEPAHVESIQDIRSVGEPCRHVRDHEVHKYLTRAFERDFEEGNIDTYYADRCE